MVEAKERISSDKFIKEATDGILVKEIIDEVLKKYQGFIEELDQSIINKYKTLKLLYSEIKNKLDQVKKVQVNGEICDYLSAVSLSLEEEKNKLKILLKFAGKNDVGSMQKEFDNVWLFNSILTNQDLYKPINEVIEEKDEDVRKQLKEEVNKYIKSIKEVESKAKKYLEHYKHIEAYTSNNVLNINISKFEQGKPIRVSDILELEKEIDGLNIYCDYKDEIRAYKQENRRYYEFKAGSYEITINWPIKDQAGKDVGCGVVIAVGANGITNILKVEIDGRQVNKLAKREVVELAQQNKEVYIQGLSLPEALEKFLGSNYQRGESIKSVEKLLTKVDQAQISQESEFTNILDTEKQELEDKVEKLEQKLNDEQQEKERVGKEVDGLREEQEKLKREKNTVLKELEKTNKKKHDLENRCEEMSQKLDEAKLEEIRLFEHLNEDFKHSILEIENLNVQQAKAEGHLRKRNAELEKELREANLEKEKLNKELQKLEDTAEQLKGTTVSLEKKIEKLEDERDVVSKGLVEINQERMNLEKKLKEEKQKLSRAVVENVELKKELDKLYKESEEIIGELNKKVQERNQKINELEAKLGKEKQSEFDKLTNELKNKEWEIEELNHKFQEIKRRSEEIQEELQETRMNLKSLQKASENADKSQNQVISDLKQKLNESTEENKELIGNFAKISGVHLDSYSLLVTKIEKFQLGKEIQINP